VCRTDADTVEDNDGGAPHHTFGIVWT
jgi:hypothetical protein